MEVRQIEPIDRAELRATIQKWIDAHTDVDDTDGVGLLEDVLWEINAQPTLIPPNEWVSVEKIINTQPILTQPPITGDTSDGYHTFNELYHHRAILFSVICNFMSDKAWKAKKHHDGTMYDGMFIVGIDTPEGQATYHYDIDPYWDLFHIKELENAPKWDGHTPDEAIRRIGNLALPNEPLMLEQLREMDGEPVWVEDVKHWALIDIEKGGQWDGVPFAIWAENGTKFTYNVESRGLHCYRRPPKEGEQ